MIEKIVINANPHPGQREVRNHPARFKVLVAGRRWGKTRLGVNMCMDAASRGKRAWWVAPSYKMAKVGWRPLMRLGLKIGAQVSKSDWSVILPGGGEVWVRSADTPNSLRGDGLDLVVMDECAYILQSAWTEGLRPALSDRKGGALFISSPAGLNWFFNLYQNGQDDGEEWMSWRKPTGDNPYIDPAEIEAARRSLPERVFRQEYLAEFLSDGTYFQKITEACTVKQPDPPEMHTGHYVVGGLDWAMAEDYTVLTLVCRDCNKAIYWDRFNQIDFTYQRKRVKESCQRYGIAGLLPERNSIGEPNIEMLLQEGVPILKIDGVPGFNTTASSKPALIQRLAAALEHDGLKAPADYDGELRAYQVENSGGRPKFGAPNGMHDDRVISLALAWWAVALRAGPVQKMENPFF